MPQTPFSAGISPLDEAHGKRLAGDPEGALRLAIAVLEAEPEQLGAAALIGRVLLDADRPWMAGEVAQRLVDGFIRRGDLPAAVAATEIGARAGDDARELRRPIARAFGKGSPRLADVSPSPPPLPALGEITALPRSVSGDALLDRAEEALRGLLRRDDPAPADAHVPELPLFSSLEPEALEQLLGAFELREVAEGETLLEQGAEGHEAYVLVRGVLEVVRSGVNSAQATLAALGPGAIFGEMALVSAAPRAASIVAVEPAMVLAVARTHLEALASTHPEVGEQLGAFCRSRMLANVTRHSPILQQVDPDERDNLVAHFEVCTFEAGEQLVRREEETQGLFVIASGGVEVYGRDEDGDALRIAELGPGDVVGEISLVLRRPATADVVATYPTIAMRLTRDVFHEAIREHPGLLNQLYEVATKREDEMRTLVAQEALDAEDVVLV